MADYLLFQFINNFTGKYFLIDYFMLFLSNYGIILLFLILFSTKNKKIITLGFFSAVVVFLFDFFIGVIFPVNRPFVDHAVNLLVEKSSSPSFPSTHSSFSFALASSIFLSRKKLGVLSLIIAFLISFSRIYVGVHYPSDILGGMMLGGVISYAISKIKWEMVFKI